MLPLPVPGAHDPRKRDSLSATQTLRIGPAGAGESRLMGGLRLIAIGGGLGVLALVALWVLWFFTAQWCSLLADQVYTAPMQVVRPSPFGWNGSYLQFEHSSRSNRWARASAGETIADRVCRELSQFRLNGKHLQLFFQDGSDAEFFVLV